jgi:hypothetical protein
MPHRGGWGSGEPPAESARDVEHGWQGRWPSRSRLSALLQHLLVWAAICLAGAAWAQDVTTYTYDALGRLVASSTTGPSNAPVQASSTYDPAGNRLNYTVSGVPVPPSNLSIGDGSVTEGGALTFTVTKSGSGAASASWTTGGGTAVAGIDYSAASGTISFTAAETSKEISVATIDDSVYESAETLTVTLSNPVAPTLIGTATGTGTINDNDTQPSLSIGNTSVTEGGTLTFTVTKSGSGAASASWTTGGGTATAGSDYSGASGTISFTAAETFKEINVATIDDSVYESAETLTVTLSNPVSPTLIGTATGTGTINDNDTQPSLSIGNTSVTEGGALTFTVTKSGSGAASASWTTGGGTATAGSDYSAASGTISFTAAETSRSITIATIDDSLTESNETLTVTLSNPVAPTLIGTATGTGTINENDTQQTLWILNAAIAEGGTLTFNVYKTGTGAASASWTTANGTATAGSDYSAASGTVSFTASETVKSITIPTTDDSLVEADETLTVTLSNPVSPTLIGIATGTGTINNNDAPPSLSIANASYPEGGTLTFVVTKTGSGAASASWTTANGTATAGSDYSAASGTISFTAAETSKSITIATIDDSIDEPDETLTVTLSNPVAPSVIGTGTGTGWINDNDP